MGTRYLIGFAGNIGVGKTSLCRLLEDASHGMAFLEPVSENPHLGAFYADPLRWSFTCQMEFLRRRADLLAQAIEFLASPQTNGWALLDRTIQEDRLFAQTQYNLARMTSEEWQTYLGWYALVTTKIARPDLIVYLRANVETLLARHVCRGRLVDVAVDGDYLAALNVQYERWVQEVSRELPVLVIEYDAPNPCVNVDDLNGVVCAIEQRLSGLTTFSLAKV